MCNVGSGWAPRTLIKRPGRFTVRNRAQTLVTIKAAKTGAKHGGAPEPTNVSAGNPHQTSELGC